MDDFEFVFSLFGLLIGFSLVEVVSGLGRAVEVRVRPARSGEGPRPRIGMLSPLLGLFVIFNLVSFWTAAWSLRGAFPVQYPVLLFGLTVTGGYSSPPCWCSRATSRSGPISMTITSR